MLDVTLDAWGSQCGRLIAISRAFSGVVDEGNQQARQEAHVDAKSSCGGAQEMFAIGILDDCVVGGNHVGTLPKAWVAILTGPPCLGAQAIALRAR
jgi:hypothetical protein